MTTATEPEFWVEGYVPPLPVGQRVRATAASELIAAGTLGTISWHHPAPTMPYRVRWDDDPDNGLYFGMSDIGWLTKPEEIEAA
jgi:hypothetical protein